MNRDIRQGLFKASFSFERLHKGRPGPARGFARTTERAIEEAKLRNDGNVEITLGLAPNETTRSFGYADFHLPFRVTIGSSLEMELEIRNDGREPLIYEDALHTFFAVANIHQASVSGLEGTAYIDKTDGFKRKKLGNQPLRVAKKTDQVHLNTEATCVVHNPVWNRKIMVEKTGSDSTVVWNPWIEKTKGMSDMAPEEWQHMVCVETANAADNAVHLSPGASHKLTASIRLKLTSPRIRIALRENLLQGGVMPVDVVVEMNHSVFKHDHCCVEDQYWNRVH
jgi:glucose-6-phosphate 1-epimerase